LKLLFEKYGLIGKLTYTKLDAEHREKVLELAQSLEKLDYRVLIVESCKDFNCRYLEKFGNCHCFKVCEHCRKETSFYDKVCFECERRDKD